MSGKTKRILLGGGLVLHLGEVVGVQQHCRVNGCIDGKGDFALCCGKKSMVFANLDVFTGLNFSTALAYDNHAWARDLPIGKFDAEVLWA